MVGGRPEVFDAAFRTAARGAISDRGGQAWKAATGRDSGSPRPLQDPAPASPPARTGVEVGAGQKPSLAAPQPYMGREYAGRPSL